MSVEMFGLTPKSLRKQRLYAKTSVLVLKKEDEDEESDSFRNF